MLRTIDWFARNQVAANLIMVLIIVGGLVSLLGVPLDRLSGQPSQGDKSGGGIIQEVFPEFALDLVTITVPYPGASPEEVEKGVLLAIEDEVTGLDGVKRVSSVAAEGAGTVSLELLLDADRQAAELAVAIRTFWIRDGVLRFGTGAGITWGAMMIRA